MIDLAALMHQCAPTVDPVVLQAIMRIESGFDPLALHVNGNVKLQSPPKTAAEAARWSQWLIDRGYSVDMGLMQINSRNLATLHLTAAAVFDPCQALRAGAAILSAQYSRAVLAQGVGTTSLLQAISAYNTGNFQAGFRNGYVGRVALEMTCRLGHCALHPIKPVPSNEPYAADSAIKGFDTAP